MKSLWRTMSWGFSPMFFPQKFYSDQVSTFNSPIYFKLYVKTWFQFHFLHVNIHFSQSFVKETISSLLCIVGVLSKMSWPYMHGFVSGLSILFYSFVCMSSCQYHTFVSSTWFLVTINGETGYGDLTSSWVSIWISGK